VVIPDSVTTIGNWAFSSCDSLTSIVIPDSVTTIGASAFANCTALTNATLGNGLVYINPSLFSYCTNLSWVVLPESINTIDNAAFENCSKLSAIYYLGTIIKWSELVIDPASNEAIDNATVYYYSATQPLSTGNFWRYVDEVITPWGKIYSEGLEYTSNSDGTCYVSGIGTCTDSRIVIPYEKINYNKDEGSVTVERITGIGSDAFAGHDFITDVVLPDSITTIGERAFQGCHSLTSIKIPNGVTSIGETAFIACSSLQSITIPESVTTIGESAFTGSGITSAIIKGNITDIATGTFEYCSSLKTVVIPKSVTTIASLAFDDCPINQVFFEGTAQDWSKISINSTNDELINAPRRYYYSATYTGDKTMWHWVNDRASGIPRLWGVASTGLLYTNTSTTTCSVRRGTCTESYIVIPEKDPSTAKTVTSIPDGGFANCATMTNIVIPSSITSIGSSAFTNCKNLQTITIPEGITAIADQTFNLCQKLNNITLPKSLTVIDTTAFNNCTSLKIIHFNGTRAEFANITGSYSLARGKKIYCSDGNINGQT
jgi:hypothetical protein